MILTIILIVLAFAEAGAIFYAFFANGIYFMLWLPVILLPICYLLSFGLVLLILLIASLFINTKKEVTKPSKVARFLVTQVVKQINMLANIHPRITGLNKVPHNSRYTIVYNHTSKFDPMLIMDKLYQDDIICVTKPSNIKIPITGPFIYKAGYIPVNRENNLEGMKAIEKAIGYIKNDVGSICISPEGTRSLDGTLLPFRAGAFNVAKRGETPIVVMGFKNNKMIHKNFPKPTKVNMDVIEVIPYEQFKDMSTQELSDYVHKLYEEYLKD